jgi:DNA replication protein DnaC
MPAHDLFKQLRSARADGSHERKLAKISSAALLIIDDLGLHPLVGEEPLDLYEIIRNRYERSATILTSNRDLQELSVLFGDPLLASAAMDRLLHHSHVIKLVGDTFRNPPAKRQRRPKPTKKEAA